MGRLSRGAGCRARIRTHTLASVLSLISRLAAETQMSPRVRRGLLTDVLHTGRRAPAGEVGPRREAQ